MVRRATFALALGLFTACGGAETPPPAPSLVIAGATIIDVRTGDRLPRHAIVMRGDTIIAVGPMDDVESPRGATVIDAGDRFVIPGLWDMHVHAVEAGRAPAYWPLLLAHGVTGVRDMGAALDSMVHWRREAWGKPARAPRTVWASPAVDGDLPSYAWSHAIRSARDAESFVDSMQSLGLDQVTVARGVSRDVFYAVAAAARRHSIPLTGEVPHDVTPEEAASAGMHSLERLVNISMHCVARAPALERERRRLARAEASPRQQAQARDALDRAWLAGADSTQCESLAQRLRTTGAWVVPTLVANRSYAFMDSVHSPDDTLLLYVPPAVRSGWEARRSQLLADYGDSTAAARHTRDRAERELVGRLWRAGVGILAGSHASDEPYIFAGASLHRELQLLVEAGLTPLAALRSATVGPAAFLARAERQGAIAPGMVADLVVLDADPLEDIRNTLRIHAVVQRGVLLHRARLDALRATVAASARH